MITHISNYEVIKIDNRNLKTLSITVCDDSL